MNLAAQKTRPLPQTLLPWILFVFSFLAVAFPLVNTDIWWHLAAGREILQTHSLPVVDRFSLSTQGRTWIDVHWLFQVVVFLLWNLGGQLGLVLGKSFLFAISVVVLFASSLSASDHARPLASVILAILVLAGYQYVYARPIIFSLFFMALFLYFLTRYTNHHEWRYLLPLVVVQIVWANTQPLFPLGVVIVGCFFAGEALGLFLKRMGLSGFGCDMNQRSIVSLGILLLIIAAASMVTPYGVDGIVIPFKLFARIGSQSMDLFELNVSENIPSWLLGRTNVLSMIVFSSVLLAAAGSFWLSMKRVSLSRLFLIVAMLVPALVANRNLLLFYWVAAPVIIANLARAFENARHANRYAFLCRVVEHPAFALGAFVLLSLPLVSILSSRTPLSEPAPFRIPTKASDEVERLKLHGDFFNSVRYGGYLIWRFFPNARPYMDGRLVLRTQDEFRSYLDMLDHPELFEAFSEQHDLDVAMLPVNQPNRYAKLIGFLYANPGWTLVYTDGTQVLFAASSKNLTQVDLSDREEVARIARSLSVRFANQDDVLQQALVNLGLLLNQVGEHGLASEILASTKGRQARALLARSFYLGGDKEAAREVCKAIVKKYPDDADSLVLLSQMALESGDLKQSVAYAKLVLEKDPFNASARSILIRIEGLTSGGTDHDGG